MNKNVRITFVFILIPVLTFAQDCKLTFSGVVKDVSTGIPISYAYVYIKELEKGDLTDNKGQFKIKSLCAGKYHIYISHIGCDTKDLYIDINENKRITILLDHNSQLLEEVDIIGKNNKESTEEAQSLKIKSISQNTDKSLATMLEDISGVSTIKNGSGVAKPVVHGLYGNRLTILNNGVTQRGQKWGADHSPEIDPLIANKITVIKGVGALEYQGSTLGSIILVEPKRIEDEPHLHSNVRYFFQSNGFGNDLNVELQRKTKALGFRVVGTLKNSGDKKTPDYYLRNTGNKEVNIATQFEKEWNNKISSNLYFSSYNAVLGVLRGSHIGNITDLNESLNRQIPFYTEDNFSYSIESPFQKVHHILIKFNTKYNINENQNIELTYSNQYNLREEYDVRRGGRSGIPALSLEQVSNLIEIKYQYYLSQNWVLKTGFQVIRINNTNTPGTGVSPLIPNYLDYELGVFSIFSYTVNNTRIEFGGRYNYENSKVATFTTSFPREVIRYENDYHNPSALIGINQNINDNWKVSYNIGYATRNPEVNELYSNGLHQGISGIEEGDINLIEEKSIKNTLSINGNVKNKLFIESLFYYQNISDYIFLKPQNRFRQTIRGAFPLYKYEQTNARLVGLDVSTILKVTEKFNIKGKYSFLNGYDQTNDKPLVYMPSNNLSASVVYQFPKLLGLQNVEFVANNKTIFEQTNLLSSQDFALPPKSYNLVNVKASAERQFSKFRVIMFIKAENLLNVRYRNYLNRQRYFADDIGFNLVVGLNVKF